MFLTERIISLLTYAAVLSISCFMMKHVIRHQWKIILWLYLLALCIFAFNYKPYVTADLYRLRQYIGYWKDLPFSRLIIYALNNNSPAWVVYSYFLDKLGNINWLQTVTCLWCYFNVFYILSKEIENNQIKRRKSLMLFYIMAVGALFLQTISGIRSMLGISIISVCIYREKVENKSLIVHLPMYLFAALLHTSSMVLVIFRFLFLVIEYKSITKRVLMILVVLVFGLFSLLYLRGYIETSFEHGMNYLTNRNEYTYFWEILIGLVETINTIYILNIYKRFCNNMRNAEKYEPLWRICVIWTVISVVLLPFSYAVFRRYTIFSTIISLPLLGRVLAFEQNTLKKKTGIYYTVWILSLIVFAISGVRGDLCGYKFFVLSR